MEIPNGALFLGAVEANPNPVGRSCTTTTTVRGDPHWLGRPKKHPVD